jgi:hypothetical protein
MSVIERTAMARVNDARHGIGLQRVTIDESYPAYLVANIGRFAYLVAESPEADASVESTAEITASSGMARTLSPP